MIDTKAKTRTLVFTGDSITDAGHYFEPTGLGDGYVRLLADQFPKDQVLNRGFNGYIAEQVYRVWHQICTIYDPDIVTLLVGINDAGATFHGGYDAEHFGRIIRKIVTDVKANTHAHMILMDPYIFPGPHDYTDWIEPLQDFRRQIRAISLEMHLGYVPLGLVFEEALKTCCLADLTVDGIHLTSLGHQLLADAWIRESTVPDSP